MDKNLEIIKSLLKKQGVESDKIQLTSTLQSFGFGPEEIDEFFNDFAKAFKIDGEEYDYYDYFFEMVHPIPMLRDMFYRLFYPSKIKKLDITIAHLLRVIEVGKWFKPD